TIKCLMLARSALLVPSHLGGVMGNRKSLAFVVVVMPVGIVECFEQGFLLVFVLLIHLASGQVGYLAVRHHHSPARSAHEGSCPAAVNPSLHGRVASGS